MRVPISCSLLIVVFTLSVGSQRLPTRGMIMAPAATINVTTTADEFGTNPGNCSLREAIQAANTNAAFGGCTAGSGADVINVPAGTYTLTRLGTDDDANQTGDLDISETVTINGAGAGSTIIDGNLTDGVLDTFAATSAMTLTLNNLTVQHGKPTGAVNFQGAAGIFVNNTVTANLTNVAVTNNVAGSGGGAIWNQGVLTLTNCNVTNNSAVDGGGIYSLGKFTVTNSTIAGNAAEKGGGIYINSPSGNDSSIDKSTLSGNNAIDQPGGSGPDFGDGAGIFADTNAQLSISNSTISGNSGARNGGGIFLSDNGGTGLGSIIVRNVTIANNTANNDAPEATGDGGGLFCVSGNFTVTNSIVALNTDGGGTNNFPDVSGTFIDGGNDLIGKNNGSNFAAGLRIGTIASPVNPNLGPLANNGGPTMTHKLNGPSVAIDGANSAVCSAAPINNVDQRNVTRPVGAGCDIGSYETTATSVASVTIAGRVKTQGSGLRNALVILTDSTGAVRHVNTSAFGYYSFDGVEAGAVVTLQVSSRRFIFAPRVLMVNDTIANVDFESLN